MTKSTQIWPQRYTAPERRLFREVIRQSADKLAHRESVLADARHTCAYPDIPQHLDAIQRFLAERSVQPEDCITVALPNSLFSAITVLALLDGGYNVLLLPEGELAAPAFSEWQLAVFDDDTSALDEPASFLRLRANPSYRGPAVSFADDAPRIYARTSGSLGVAKLAVHSYQRFRDNIRCTGERLRLDPSCRIALPIPIFHLFGLGPGLLSGFDAGASLDFQQRANLLSYFEREADFNPNVAFVAPSFWETVLRARRAPRPYRFVLIGGDRTSELTRSASERLHAPLINGYGSTEMGFLSAGDLSMPAELRAGTVGRLLPGVVARLVPVTGEHADQTASCELQIQSPYSFHGYVDMEGRSLAMPAAFDGDWFCTRDLACQGPEDTLQILGRCDLSVNRNGRLVPFADVESRLRSVEDVLEVAVAAGREDIRGRSLIAFCVIRAAAGVTAQELRARSAECLPAFAVPDTIVTLAELPKLANGKVDRRALSTLAAGKSS